MRYVQILFLIVISAMGCGGSTIDNSVHEVATATMITIRTVDQFGNPVPARILRNADLLGIKEVKLSYSPATGGKLSFDPLSGYAAPTPIDLKDSKYEDGEVLSVKYIRSGQAANVCPRGVNAVGQLVDAQITVNGLSVDYQGGHCQAVDISRAVDIQSAGTLNIYAIPLYIPAGKLTANATYNYELRFLSGEAVIYVHTTPVQGEVFIDGRSMGWSKKIGDFVVVQLLPEEEVQISFGEVNGYETAKPIKVKATSVDASDAATSHFWGLYDPAVNALACFTATNNGNSTSGKVLVDEKIDVDIGYNYPGCIGLNTDTTHTAVYEKVEDNQSNDLISISTGSHVGCQGLFLPGEQLTCNGKYFYVQPDQQRTEYFAEVRFTGTYRGKSDYPILGRFELNGIQNETQSYTLLLKTDESVAIKPLPIGILQPSTTELIIDSSVLSEDDPSFDPEKNSWIFQVGYPPPTGAVETCVKSLNQNEVNISSELGFKFDGVPQLNNPNEDFDCHWLLPTGSHVAVPDFLNGYTPAVSQIYIPDGQVQLISDFELPFIPLPNQYQICVTDIPVETGLLLNNHRLGWTNIGQKCLWLDKSQANSLTIEGKWTGNFVAEDPALPGTGFTFSYADLPLRGPRSQLPKNADCPLFLTRERAFPMKIIKSRILRTDYL